LPKGRLFTQNNTGCNAKSILNPTFDNSKVEKKQNKNPEKDV
jgi:hypothetical protein